MKRTRNNRILLTVLCVAAITSFTFAKTNTTRKNLSYARSSESIVSMVDTVVLTQPEIFCDKVVTMRGYSKRAGESKESFVLINNSNLHISQVEIEFRYTDTKGVPLHERTVLVTCDLPPYSVRNTWVKTFDEGHNYYFYNSKSRKDAFAYMIEINVVRYDVKVMKK